VAVALCGLGTPHPDNLGRKSPAPGAYRFHIRAGPSAKAVIDIVLAVAASADEGAYVPPLEREGYVLRIREPDWFEHRLLKSPAADVNLHVFSDGCEEIRRLLAFRDWLRTHEDDRTLYERTKQALAAQTWKYMQNYADAKSEVVTQILSRALGT
jgi:GrpB-like predicted nucleotidyltransferase (UPF0157 family)